MYLKELITDRLKEVRKEKLYIQFNSASLLMEIALVFTEVSTIGLLVKPLR